MSVKGAYVRVARGTGAALSKAGLRSNTPPDRSTRWRHWAYSLPMIYDSKSMVELDIPWWSYRAIDYVQGWIAGRAGDVRVFEFGTGASTVFLAKRAREVHSVENDAEFAAMMRPRIAAAGTVDLLVREPVPSKTPAVASHRDGFAGLDFADYVATIDDVGGKFDIIIIDGRAREVCLTRSIPHLADDGIIIYDNSRRARYAAAIAASGLAELQFKGLTPTLPYPDQTSILTRPGA